VAILTDAFPAHQRGLALGINQVAGLAGSFIGLIVGGVLAATDWRAVFWVSVPFGILGAVWAYLALRDLGQRSHAGIDWVGNLSFAAGLIAVLVAVTHGIQPYGGHTMGWTSPLVLGLLAGLLASIARGGLQFMLIIWLQGIWLPPHGYSFEATPLWAGIYLAPLTLGFLVAGPVSGWLSDRYGARPFATGGMLLAAASFAAMLLLPVDFSYRC
jgi:MFS family permease